jgi:hypothetical protein
VDFLVHGVRQFPAGALRARRHNAGDMSALASVLPDGAAAEVEPAPQQARELAHQARTEWREAKQKRASAARRAELLARLLAVMEQRAEARAAREAVVQATLIGKLAREAADRVAAARAAARARREAEQRRLRAAARVERLELQLASSAEAGARSAHGLARRMQLKRALHYVGVLAIGLAAGTTWLAFNPWSVDQALASAAAPAPVLGDAPAEGFRLRLDYRLGRPG